MERRGIVAELRAQDVPGVEQGGDAFDVDEAPEEEVVAAVVKDGELGPSV